MDFNKLFTILAIILITVIILFKIKDFKSGQKLSYDNNKDNIQSNISSNKKETSFDKKTALNKEIVKQFNRVEVGVKLQQSQINKPIIMTLALNNHEISLDYDFTKISTLKDQSGYNYKAVKWEGGKGGHHIRGKLIFEPLKEVSKSLILTIVGVDDTQQSYNWQLENSENSVATYKNITPEKLQDMLVQKDFKLIDVHIPEQEHIPGTDKMIAYNQLDKIIKEIGDKNQKVVLYCRSGGMSTQVGDALVAKGYTNIYNLSGGMNAWKATGAQTLSVGSIKK